MFFSKLGFTPLMFTVGFSRILKGHDHLMGFFNTAAEQIPFPSWYILRSLFLSFCIPKKKKTLLSNSLEMSLHPILPI